MITLVVVSVFAAFISGGLGYGFSSITVPVGLLFYTNRTLNPALVLVEIVVNASVVLLNRRSLGRIFHRIRYILLGLLPAVVLGSFVLKAADPTWIKLGTYLFLLPFILFQSMGFSKPLNIGKRKGLFIGGLVGLVYSMTTLSGPPLAVLLKNESLEKEDFKAAIGVIRLGESLLTASAYALLGFFSIVNLELFLKILPGVCLAIPLGSLLISRLDPVIFRRLCVSFDAYLVAFGLYKTLAGSSLLGTAPSLALAGAVVAMDAVLLYRWILRLRRHEKPPATAFERFEGVWGLWLPALPPKAGKESHVHP